mmetsp:Transcript_90957/g.175092  ORF Transcript_90957/g.175092 Transcript_90957/m.175092 type:complete len:131 (-) Transcript_90957:252-644(-)
MRIRDQLTVQPPGVSPRPGIRDQRPIESNSEHGTAHCTLEKKKNTDIHATAQAQDDRKSKHGAAQDFKIAAFENNGKLARKTSTEPSQIPSCGRHNIKLHNLPLKLNDNSVDHLYQGNSMARPRVRTHST